MKAGAINLKRQCLNLNFCLKINNEYVDDIKFIYMNWGLKQMHTIVAQNERQIIALASQTFSGFSSCYYISQHRKRRESNVPRVQNQPFCSNRTRSRHWMWVNNVQHARNRFRIINKNCQDSLRHAFFLFSGDNGVIKKKRELYSFGKLTLTGKLPGRAQNLGTSMKHGYGTNMDLFLRSGSTTPGE